MVRECGDVYKRRGQYIVHYRRSSAKLHFHWCYICLPSAILDSKRPGKDVSGEGIKCEDTTCFKKEAVEFEFRTVGDFFATTATGEGSSGSLSSESLASYPTNAPNDIFLWSWGCVPYRRAWNDCINNGLKFYS